MEFKSLFLLSCQCLRLNSNIIQPAFLLVDIQIWISTEMTNFKTTVRPWDAHFFGKEKNRAAQNSYNFCYLLRLRQDDKKPCCSRFSLNKFIHLKFFWTQFKKVQLRGPCSSRPCILRPYCTSIPDSVLTQILQQNVFQNIVSSFISLS